MEFGCDNRYKFFYRGGVVMRSAFFMFLLFWVFIAFMNISYAKDYLIAPSDVLEISIWGEDQLVKQVVVRPDGKISFPLVGDIKAAGRTTSQVKEEIEKKIREYITDAIASVIVTQLGSLQYYVVGKVAKPGMFNVAKPVTVLQALALAGGLTPFANQEKILIIRGHGKNSVIVHFNYKEIKKGKHLEQNILLQRGDVVLVP